MVRAEVGEHMEASRAAHERLAWGRAAEMEKKLAAQELLIAEQAERLRAQGKVIFSSSSLLLSSLELSDTTIYEP